VSGGFAASSARRFGDIEFDDAISGTLKVGGQRQELHNKEMRLLEIFLSALARIFSKAKLGIGCSAMMNRFRTM